MLNLGHKKLEIWKKCLGLIYDVYYVTTKFPSDEKFVLVSQMRRAAISVSSNISEGASRSSSRERKRFYEIARSSLVELDTQLEIALMLEFVTDDELMSLGNDLNEIFAMLTSMKSRT